MTQYILPITATVISFISFINTFSYLFGKRFWMWIAPCLLSLVLFCSSGLWLYGLVFDFISHIQSDIQDCISIVLTVLSGLWFLSVCIFRIAAVPADRTERKRKRAVSEANYVSVGDSYKK